MNVAYSVCTYTTGLSLRIVPAYEGMADFVAAARFQPGANLDDLWRRLVLDAYWNQWAAGEYNEARVRQNLSRPYEDLDGLQREVDALECSGIEIAIDAVYARICELLPYHEGDTAVCILAADPQDHQLLTDLQGVVGECVGGNTLLRVNPAARDWQAMLPYVLAHERHHSAWGYHHYILHHDLAPSLLASLISEGSADAFASQMVPGVMPCWIDALEPEEEERQWRAMQPYLHEPDYDGALYRRFFFGDPASDTPPFAAYTIAFHILQGYLRRHPGESPAEWTMRSPAAIFLGSGYPG